jgi:hypothetical protein
VEGGSKLGNNLNYQLSTDEITRISDAQKVDSGTQTSRVPSQAEIKILSKGDWVTGKSW